MPTNIFTGDTASVAKVVWVGLPSGVNLSNAQVSIGLGSRRIESEGWNPTDIANAWSTSTDAILSTVLCEVPSGGATFGGLTSPLRFTHRTSGEDFQLVVEVDGAPLLVSNEIHTLVFSSNTTGGTFTLTVDGETTAAITYDSDGSALALAMQTAVENLAGIGIGDVIITHDSGTFTFDYSSGAFQGQAVTLLVADASLLTGTGPLVDVSVVQEGAAGQTEIDDIAIIPQPVYGDASVTITTVTEGGPGQNTIYDIELYPGLTSGTFRLTINGTETADIEWDATAAEVKTEIDLILTGGETVTVTGGDLPGTIVTVEFTGDFADAPQAMSITNPALVGDPGITIATTNEGSTLTVLNDALITYYDFKNPTLDVSGGEELPNYRFEDRLNANRPFFREDTTLLTSFINGRCDGAVRTMNAVNDGLGEFDAPLVYARLAISRPQEWGFSLWVKPSDIETAQLNDQVIWQNDTAGYLSIVPGETNFTLNLSLSSSGQPWTTASLVLDTATYADQWIMITGTLGNGGRDVSLAINDENFVTTTAAVNDQVNSMHRPLWLGGQTAPEAFSGTFDRFMWFNKTLTQDDVDALFNDGLGQDYPVQSNKTWANIAGYWPLGEGAGPRNDIIDTSALGFSTLDLNLVNGASAIAGKNGDGQRLQNNESIRSQGTNRYVGKQISARHGLSISFWMKFESGYTSQNTGRIMEFTLSDGSPSQLENGLLTFYYLASTDEFRFEYLNATETSLQTVDFAIPGGTVDDTWYHITFNPEGDANDMDAGDQGCFVDGVKVSTGSLNFSVTGAWEYKNILSRVHMLNAGIVVGGSSSVQIDELAFWSRARLASQILDHYNAGAGKYYSTADEVQTILTTGTTPTFGYIDITWDGNTTSEVPANATAQEIVDGMAAIGGSGVSASGGPLPAMITLTYGGAQGNTDQPEITAAFSNHQYRAEQTTLGFAAVDEVQRVVVDAAKGDFTLTHSAVETTDIPYDSDAAGLKTILDAMGIGTFAVAEIGTNTWEITFQGALAGADQALFTYDQTGLSGPPIDGLIGGTYALKIIDDGTTHDVLGIPWNASNSTIEEMVNDVMGVSEVAVTNGPLPATPIRMTFGDRPLDVEVFPALTVSSEESLVSVVRDAKEAAHKDNTWELTVIPGDGTPGVSTGGGKDKLNVHFFTLRIDTPNGILSRKFDPFYNYDRGADEWHEEGDSEFIDTVQVRPNLVQVRFTQLDPRTLEQVINEALMCGEAVKVTRIVHSFECAEFDSQLYGSGETENDTVRVWYYRDVFRLTFINEFADKASIDSISVVMPEVITKEESAGGLGGLFGGPVVEETDPPDVDFRPIEPRDYMPILPESTDAVTPLGTFDQTGIKDDAAMLNYRTAMAFQLAWMAGTPINKHEIVRTDEVVDDHLSYRYNMQNLAVDHLGNPTNSARIGVADMLVGGQIQFQWCTRQFLNEGEHRMSPTYAMLSETTFLDWDAPSFEIQAAIEKLFVNLSTNDGVFPGVGGVQVTGSLYNSWKSDPYQNYGTIDDESALDVADRYNELRITLTGPWAKQPFNEYEYCLRCVYRNNYPWIGPRKETVLETEGWDAEDEIGSGYVQTVRTPKIWMDEHSKPLLPRRNQRISIDVSEEEDDSVTLLLGGNTFEVNRASTATQFGSQVNGVLGSVSSISRARNMVWNDEDRRWEEELRPIGEDGFEWVPFKYLNSITAYGTTLDRHPVEVEFTGMGYQYIDHTLPSVTSDEQQAEYMTVTEIQPGIAGTDEIQFLAITGSPTQGGYELDYNGDSTNPIAWDADAATIQSELEGLTGLSAGDVTVTGSNGTFSFTFDGPLIDPDTITAQNSTMLAACTITVGNPSSGGLGGSITVMESVRGSGPQFFDVPGNWSLKRLPSSGDDLVIDEAVQPLLYGLNMSGAFVVASADGLYLDTERRRRFLAGQKVYVQAGSEVGDALPTGLAEGYYFIKESYNDGTFSLSTTDGGARVVSTGTGTGNSRIEIRDCTLSVNARFSGAQIGLPKRRGDEIEYLPQYLRMGFTDIILGIGDGDGMTLVRIDTIDSEAAIEVITTAGSSVDNIPTALFLTNNVNAAITVRSGGDAGVAVYAGEESIIGDVVVDNGGSLTIAQDAINGSWTNNGDLLTLHTGVSG